MTDTEWLDTEWLAWAAGLFEGEGCICSGQYPGLRLVMTDRDRVEKFAEVVGRGTVSAFSARSRESHWKQAWRWQVVGPDDPQAVIVSLGPWLGPRRLERWNEVWSEWARAETEKTAPFYCESCNRLFRPFSGRDQKYCSRWCAGEEKRKRQRRGYVAVPKELARQMRYRHRTRAHDLRVLREALSRRVA